MADGEALHIVAHAVTRKQDLGRKGSQLANTTLVQSRNISFATGSRHCGQKQTAIGAFFRRLAARVGKAKAVTEAARNIAVLFYKTLRYGAPYKDPGADYYEERFRRRTLENLRRRANALGFKLVESDSVREGVS